MKLILPFIILLLISFITGCSDNPSAVDSKYLSVQTTETSMVVGNGAEKTIYYFAVERNLAARISWAPVSEKENEIKTGQSKQILFSNLKAKKGDQILFYYWSTKKPKSEDIQNIIVETE